MSSATPLRPAPPTHLNALDWVALVLMVIGGINWGLVGALDLDLVATLFGPGALASRVVYMGVGLAALYGVVLMARLGRSAPR
jgi:uncharacterized membrane protein YuzA (DUF378 family)